MPENPTFYSKSAHIDIKLVVQVASLGSEATEEQVLNALCRIFGITLGGCNPEGLCIETLSDVTELFNGKSIF